MKRLATILLALTLAACGGGSVEDDYTGPTADASAEYPAHAEGRRKPRRPAQQSTTPTKVVLYGHSIEAGTRLSNGSSPAAEAHARLLALGHNFTVTHDAIGGSTADSLVHGRDRIHLGTPFSTFMPATGASIIGLHYAHNEPREEFTLEQFKARIETLVAQSRAAGKVVVLSTPTPVSAEDGANPKMAAFIPLAAEAVREVQAANADMTVLCDQFRFVTELGWTATLDGVHPTEEMTANIGHRRANCILRAADLLPITP